MAKIAKKMSCIEQPFHISVIFFLQNFPVQKYAKWPLTFVLSVKSLKVRTMSAADFPAYLPYKFSHLKFIKILSLRAMFPHLIHIFYKFFKCKIMCEKAVYICTIRRKTLRIATTSRTDIWGLFFGWIFLLEICKKKLPNTAEFLLCTDIFCEFFKCKIMCGKVVYICTIRRKTLKIQTTFKTDISRLFLGWIFA